MGSGRRPRLGLHDALLPDRLADRAARRSPGPARFGGPSADGHAHRSVWRASRVHRVTRLLISRRVRRSADHELSGSAARRVPDRHAGLVIRRRRGVRVPVDAGRTARDVAGYLRTRHDGSVARGLRRSRRGGALGLADGVLRDQRAAARLVGGVRGARAESRWRGATGKRRRHGGRAAPLAEARGCWAPSTS